MPPENEINEAQQRDAGGEQHRPDAGLSHAAGLRARRATEGPDGAVSDTGDAPVATVRWRVSTAVDVLRGLRSTIKHAFETLRRILDVAVVDGAITQPVRIGALYPADRPRRRAVHRPSADPQPRSPPWPTTSAGCRVTRSMRWR